MSDILFGNSEIDSQQYKRHYNCRQENMAEQNYIVNVFNEACSAKMRAWIGAMVNNIGNQEQR
jgi:hypothetical protein